MLSDFSMSFLIVDARLIFVQTKKKNLLKKADSSVSLLISNTVNRFPV